MVNDPELKAMSDVFDSLQNLDDGTRRRVVDWVLAKLDSGPSSGGSAEGAKRGPKPGSKRAAKKRGRKPHKEPSAVSPTVGTKRGPKPGKKRGPKPGTKRNGKRGRPPGSKNKVNKIPGSTTLRRRSRPRKTGLA